MKYLSDEEDQLIYKIGFYPNLINKKSKMIFAQTQKIDVKMDIKEK
jgi:hypothetical protein